MNLNDAQPIINLSTLFNDYLEAEAMSKAQLEMLNYTYVHKHSEGWLKLNIDQDLAIDFLNLELLSKPPGLYQSIWFCFVFPRRASGTLLFISPFFTLMTYWKQPTEYVLCHFGAYLLIFLKKASRGR